MECCLFGFFNYINDVVMLFDVICDCWQEKGMGIGEKVVDCLIKVCIELFGCCFESFKQVVVVFGVGQDKLFDFMYVFKQLVVQVFCSNMYNGVIFSNWELEYFIFIFEDEIVFQEVIDFKFSFVEFVGEQVE